MTQMLKHYQHTISRRVSCTGVGLHSGADVTLTLLPAPEGHGIRFCRTDITDKDNFIPADVSLVTETRLGTTLTNTSGVSIATVEHLMAAIAGMAIDNLLIEVSGPEVPIMDGSSEPFLFLFDCAGLKKQSARRRYWKLHEAVRVQEGKSWIAASPSHSFTLDMGIEFDHQSIGKQHMAVDFSRHQFRDLLSRARTFGFAHEVEMLQKMGLARGGSLDNAIVLNDTGIENSEGLRYADEFIRHKILDCVGDFYLAGHPMLADIKGIRPGHGINRAFSLEMRNYATLVTLDELELMPATTAATAAAASIHVGGGSAISHHAPQMVHQPQR